MTRLPLQPLRERLRRLAGRPANRRGDTHDEDRPEAGLRSDGGSADEAHLEDVPDGAGCTEIWEHLSGGTPAEVVADD